MIRKLFAGTTVLAIAVLAVMLLGIGSSSKSADAHVTSITGPSTIDNSLSEFEVRINAVDGHGDVFIGASDGHFSWDGADCQYANEFTNCDVTQESGGVGDIAQFLIVDDGPGFENVNSIFIDYTPPQGLSGGSIDIFACQEDQEGGSFNSDLDNIDCPNGIRKTIQVVGAVKEIKLYALRDYSNDEDLDLCTGTPVFVIAALEYTDSAWDTADFDNHRAIICAEVRDSAGHPVENAKVFWSDSGPGCIDGQNPEDTNGDGVSDVPFWHCDTGNQGEVSTVSGCVGSVCGTVDVEFGGNPARCEIVVDPTDLNIGDVASINVQWWDDMDFKVPDGVVSYFTMSHSGVSSANATLIDSPENTVNSMAEGSAITAFDGISTVSATAVNSPGSDVSCADVLDFTGDVHTHPDECIVDGVEDEDFVLSGTIPPGGNYEWGTFVFCGGSYDALLEASGCDADEAVFYYNKPDGDFAVWVPNAPASVNAEIFAIFEPEHGGIDANTIFTAACSANEGTA